MFHDLRRCPMKKYLFVIFFAVMAMGCDAQNSTYELNLPDSVGVHCTNCPDVVGGEQEKSVNKQINYNVQSCVTKADCNKNQMCMYDYEFSDYICVGVCQALVEYEEYTKKDQNGDVKKYFKENRPVDTCDDGWYCFVEKDDKKETQNGWEGQGLCMMYGQCEKNDDCGEDETCYNGQCLFTEPECFADGDCDGGEVCSYDGRCVAATGENSADEDECDNDDDCQTGETCEGGKCVKEDEPDPPVVDGHVLQCTIKCTKTDYYPLVWYGSKYNKDGKYMEDNPGSFSVSKCDMCTWGFAEFHYNCYYGDSDSPDDWGYGMTAEVDCEFDDVEVKPELSNMGDGKTKAVFDNIDCTTCW